MFPSYPFKEKKNKQKPLCSQVMEQCVTENQEMGHRDSCFSFQVNKIVLLLLPKWPWLGQSRTDTEIERGEFEKRKGLERGLLFPCPPPCPWSRDGNSLFGWRVLHRWPEHVHMGTEERTQMGSDWKKRCVCYGFGNLYLRSTHIHRWKELQLLEQTGSHG